MRIKRSLQMKKDKPCEGEGKEKRREGERFNNETITAMIWCQDEWGAYMDRDF